MDDVESLEPMQAANTGTTALHGPISAEPTSTSSLTVHPEYIDADNTPSPAEGPASGVDGIRVLGILLTNREITEQLGGNRWIGNNLIEIRVQLMNLLLHRKLGLQRRVWPVTLWRKKSLPQKENCFDLDWFILVCGEEGHWWVVVFYHLLSSPEVWILDSLCPDSAQRQQRGTVLWDLLKRHWQVHNQHQPWPFSTDVNLKKFHCIHQPDGWSCAVFVCYGAEWVVSLVLGGSEVDLSPLSLELSELDLENVLCNWHRTVRLLHTDVVPNHPLFPDSRTPSSVSTMPARREEQMKMAEEEGMIYHCWASISPMHASSTPPIVAYSAKDRGAKRAGSRQRGRCGGSTGSRATDFKHLGCTRLMGLAQQYNEHPLIQVRGKRSKPQRKRAKQWQRQQRRQQKEWKEEQRRKSPLRKKREEKRQKEHQHQPERKQEEKRRSRNCQKNSLQVCQELHDSTL